MDLTGGLRNNLPPGFHYQPTDQELIFYYLNLKVLGRRTYGLVQIHEVDVYAFHPSNLIPPGKTHTYNYTFMFAKNSSSKRINCVVPGYGTWKTNGNAHPILDKAGGIIGYKLLLTFQEEGSKKASGYIMHEYTLLDEAKSKWALCLIKLSPQKENEIKKKLFDEAMKRRRGDGLPPPLPSLSPENI